MSRFWGCMLGAAVVVSVSCGPPPPPRDATGTSSGTPGTNTAPAPAPSTPAAPAQPAQSAASSIVPAGEDWVCWDSYDGNQYVTSGCWRAYGDCQRHVGKMIEMYPNWGFSSCTTLPTAACYTYYLPDMAMHLPSCHTTLDACEIELDGLERDIQQGLDNATQLGTCGLYE